MGYAVGHNGHRWVGYRVPAECDFVGCREKIVRGMAFLCGGGYLYDYLEDDYEDYGWEDEWWSGCEDQFYFCGSHSYHPDHAGNMEEKGESPEWLRHIMTDETWEEWRRTDPNYQKYYEMWKELDNHANQG